MKKWMMSGGGVPSVMRRTSSAGWSMRQWYQGTGVEDLRRPRWKPNILPCTESFDLFHLALMGNSNREVLDAPAQAFKRSLSTLG